MTRNRARVSNGDLANAIKRLEVRQDTQEDAMKQLKAEVAPLRDMLLGIHVTVKIGGFLLGVLSAAGTAVAIYTSLHH